MRSTILKASLIQAGLAASVLLFAGGSALADTINVTAASTTTTLPDGQTVPMWGYSCSDPDTTDSATCAPLNPNAAGNWSPIVITIAAGTPLTINLTNNLSFTGTNVPTSIMIAGQIGGGLGTDRTMFSDTAFLHGAKGVTWPGTPEDATPGVCGDRAAEASNATFCPPAQVPRVRSLATEVAVGTPANLTWSSLRPGTYLIESATEPSIQVPMGLYGMLVVTDASYPGVASDAALNVLTSEIDPVQNAEVDQVVRNAGFSDETVWSGQLGACGDVTQPATAHTCYPPAVNYQPLYYLVNGAAFNRGLGVNDQRGADLSVATTPSDAGNVLLRLVNAGLRMHVPSVVGSTMTLLAEDGNILPGAPKVQSEVFLAPGKTYDVAIQPQQAGNAQYQPATYAFFDRSLDLSTNNQRDGGMQTYINIGNGQIPARVTPTANDDTYQSVAQSGNVNVKVTDPARGVLANDSGLYGVGVMYTRSGATVTLNANGTFTYSGPIGTSGAHSGAEFTYCGNGTSSGGACANVNIDDCTLANGCQAGSPTGVADAFDSKIDTRFKLAPPGVLSNDTDPAGLPLTAQIVGTTACTENGAPGILSDGMCVQLNADGSFTATRTTGAVGTPLSFSYMAVNSQGTSSAATTAQVTFEAGSGLVVHLLDTKTGAEILNAGSADYRWIIEQDRTLYIDPACQTNRRPQNDSEGNPCPPLPVQSLGYNFHTSFLPVVAQGCVGDVSCEAGQTMIDTNPSSPTYGTSIPAVCDVGNGECRTDGIEKAPVTPGQVNLDPSQRYYLSIGPFDGAGAADEGHTMGGAQITSAQITDCATNGGTACDVNVYLDPTPVQPAKMAVFVFEDDWPLNGEHDASGGAGGTLAPNEPGLGGFNLILIDQAGMLGDPAGNITYDEFGNPVTNSLAHMTDPATGMDACPISDDIPVGQIVTCPTYESDGTTLSPLAGHAVIDNLYAGLYEVQATPGADRIAKGEEWLQTNTLDGTKPIEAFLKPGEPGYFQEFGPGGFHVAVGFANPNLINDRKAAHCNTDHPCTAELTGTVTNAHMSRTPDQRVFSTGDYSAYAFGNCYASLGSPDEDDFAFAKCDPDGHFTFTNIPANANYKLTIFDQWNDLIVDGLSTPVVVNLHNVDDSVNSYCHADAGDGHVVCNYEIPVTQWRANLYGGVFLDTGNGTPGTANDGVREDGEPGLPLVPYNLRYRDGSYFGFNNTDLAGGAGFNEVFPLLNWLVIDTDQSRYKTTGVHVVYDAGGAVDGTTGGGSSGIADHLANSTESPTAHVPLALRVPGARYCQQADCAPTDPGFDPDPTTAAAGSTGRVDPGWVTSEAWQGLLGQNSFVTFAMKPFAPGENGGVKGHVFYMATRPFDDPALLLQLPWAPGVPNVTIKLYAEGTAADGTQALHLVDTTQTSSWDDFAQGYRTDGNPNMSCPGQEAATPFYFNLQDSTTWLNPTTPMAEHSRFKCYDGWSMLNQVQPAPYDGLYQFPSVTSIDPSTGRSAGTNCHMATTDEPWGCIANPSSSVSTDPNYDAYRSGAPMLKPGKYVVEVVVPPGYELVKEEDKNLYNGDLYDGPVVSQFAGFGNIFIMPDQASVREQYNPYNSFQATVNNGALPRHEGDTGSVETFWPCVGAMRVVPDQNSFYPGAAGYAPFAGATRPLCDRKEIQLTDDMTALAKFYVFTSADVAGKYTGTITDDFASEFDPFSPQLGEKYAPPNMPVAFRTFSGKEVSRTYADQWGRFNGANFSSFSVNPPTPSGYIPQMMIACMNDPGPIPDPSGAQNPDGSPVMIQDPNYNPGYSNYCYEIPFMPGQQSYMDTPVVPTMAFASGYNLPDCSYPDTTPAIASVLGDAITGGGAGPWVSASGAGHTLTITALGNQQVLNPAYSGPSSTATPFTEKHITRHYGFGTDAGTVALVDADGVAHSLTNISWSDTTITGDVPDGVPACQASNPSYPSATERCGELVITRADNGKQSIDTVTVTIGGPEPMYVTPDGVQNPPSGFVDYSANFGRNSPSPLQNAIDNATPGQLIIVAPGSYRENLLMWKPVRLQGVGAASTTVNADAHPAGKMDAWRRQVDCVFGLTLEGRPAFGPSPEGAFDPSGAYTCPAEMANKVDRNDAEGIIGWDATTNGNLAEQLQEPTLMGAYEGAGITVLGKGVKYPAGADPFAVATEGVFPAGTLYLGGVGTVDCTGASDTDVNFDGFDHHTSNYRCNPSRIDGLSVINSSQGGGAIYLHGWNHFTNIGNNRVYANHGTLTGGITIGTPEFGPAYAVGGDVPVPFDVPSGLPLGYQFGYGKNVGVNVHNNFVSDNASLGDALFSGTNSGAGGVSMCVGADGYKLVHNWVCGNLSSGDGAGISHIGFSNDGTIANNSVLFNQSFNPTIPTNGGGIAIHGAAPDRLIAPGVECGSTTDQDCPPALAEGTGRNLLIDSNLIQGNSSEGGSGGGLRLQVVNGIDVQTFPSDPQYWNDVTVTNNIISNNVAGWDGAGVSLVNALKVKFVNNTVASNDTTASAGVLFNTLGAPLASVPPPGCAPPTIDPSCPRTITTSYEQPAGLVTMHNTPNLDDALAALPAGVDVMCPDGYGYGTGTDLVNGTCTTDSLPLLANNLFWHNRAFHIEVGDLGTGTLSQQKVVTLVPSLNQTSTGFCATTGTDTGAPGSGDSVHYWDIGVRGDADPASVGADGVSLSPTSSILTSLSGRYAATDGNLAPTEAGLVALYCNGARVPPEDGGHGYQAPPGHSETTGLYPVFALNQLTPAATVDEGNNWINLNFGPLSLSNGASYTGSNTALAPLSDAHLTSSSAAINAGADTTTTAPSTGHDFFGQPRSDGSLDIGAVEYVAP